MGDGLAFIREQKEATPDVEMVIMTAFADGYERAIEALKAGAFDYLPKPFENEQLEKIVRNIGDKRSLSRRYRR